MLFAVKRVVAVPVEPYFIKAGRYVGRSAEELMLEDPAWLLYMLRLMDSNAGAIKKFNGFHSHLIWLMNREENRTAGAKCPHCGKAPVAHFCYCYYPGKQGFYLSCDYSECKGKILTLGAAFPLKPTSVGRFHNKKLQAEYLKVLWKAYFPNREKLTAQELFQFFAKDP